MIFSSSIPVVLAAADGISGIIFLLIVGAITLAQKAFEYYKKKSQEPPPYQGGDRSGSYETAHEKQIREIIRSLNWGEDAAPIKSVLTATAGTGSSDVVPSAPSEAPQNVMEQAAASMSAMPTMAEALSDAEQAALERLRHGATSALETQAVAASTEFVPQIISAGGLKSGLNDREILKAAILYQEILGKPLALRLE